MATSFNKYVFFLTLFPHMSKYALLNTKRKLRGGGYVRTIEVKKNLFLGPIHILYKVSWTSWKPSCSVCLKGECQFIACE